MGNGGWGRIPAKGPAAGFWGGNLLQVGQPNGSQTAKLEQVLRRRKAERSGGRELKKGNTFVFERVHFVSCLGKPLH